VLYSYSRDASLENLQAEEYHWRKQSVKKVNMYKHSILDKKISPRKERFFFCTVNGSKWVFRKDVSNKKSAEESFAYV